MVGLCTTSELLHAMQQSVPLDALLKHLHLSPKQVQTATLYADLPVAGEQIDVAHATLLAVLDLLLQVGMDRDDAYAVIRATRERVERAVANLQDGIADRTTVQVVDNTLVPIEDAIFNLHTMKWDDKPLTQLPVVSFAVSVAGAFHRLVRPACET